MREVHEDILKQFRGHGRCEGCTMMVNYREAAHVYGKGMGGWARLDHEWNLVSLCRSCHARHHAGTGLSREGLLTLVAIRTGQPPGIIRDKLLHLLARITDPGKRRPKKRRAKK